MNKIEEQLWNYIDGNCTAEEVAQIKAKLLVDGQYQKVYEELLAVNKALDNLDFEEPSMSFSRNVMEQVNLEIKPVALKTKVDNRIVYSIMVFFLVSMLGIVGYVISQSDFSLSASLSKINFKFDTEKLITPTFFKVFLMVDVVLILLFIDNYLRKGLTQKKGV
ncbi:MAG: hypothetical protein EOO47_05520 [Flavobacterium sp.]|nr:MAG: hypothetical protein EOO47_05520 [Flavobacterium sp.]